MDAASVCRHDIVSIDAAQPLQQAALLMRERHVGALVVTTAAAEGQHVAGVVTDRDLAIEVLARGGDAAQIPVGRLVRGAPVGVPGSASLAEAIAAMQAAGVRRLLVHDAAGRLVGLLSASDLLPALVAPLAALADVSRREIARETAERGTIAAQARPTIRVPAMGTAGWREGPPAG